MNSPHRIVLLIPLLMVPLILRGQGEDFYESRLKAGQQAYRQKRIPEAIDEFRISAFGFLNRPSLLSESLVRLALAQDAAGRTAEAEATLSRFLEVERRFSTYAQVKLEPEIRTEFQALLLKRVSPATIQSVPSLAGLVETEEQRIANLPTRDRRKALEAGLRREPGNVAWPLGLAREAAGRQDHKAVVEWAGKALELSPGNAEALALRAHARVERRDYQGALADLKVLPPSEVARRPELSADQFVCLVEAKDWSAAQAAGKLVTPNFAARSDVARAQEELSKHRLQVEAVTRSPTTSSSAASAQAPPNPPSGNAAKPVPSNTGQANPSSKGAVKPVPSSTDQANPLSGNVAKAVPSNTPTPFPQASAATTKPPGQGAARAGPAHTANDALVESRRLVKAGRAAEAEGLLLETLKTDPDNRELRLALLEASCLAGAWNRAAEQLPRISPLAESEAPSMFYAAVALYETGRTEEARSLLTRSLPKVSGPLVDEYSQKILGRR